ncbi:MAG: hypothetical protein AB7S77_06120 [Desulfatirhabdiaceae bacterium]
MTHLTSMRRSKLVGLVILVAIFLSGCGLYRGLARTTEKIGESITGSDGSLRKKIGITLLNNQAANVTGPLAGQIQTDIHAKLKAVCPDVIWIGPDEPDYPAFIRSPALSASGNFDNVALARAARKNGYQAIFQLSLLNIDVHQYDKGILWFKKTHQTGRLLWSVAIYDSETSAKLLNQSYPYDFNTDSNDIEAIRQSRLDEVSGLTDAIDRSLVIVSKEICKTLKTTPWKGFITQVTDNVITLSSGAGAGLKAGQELMAYAPGEAISGTAGQSYLLQGKKTGKIRITRVMEDQAEAESMGDTVVESGGMVQTR